MLMGEPQFLLQVALVGLAARYSFECTVLTQRNLEFTEYSCLVLVL